MHVSQSYWKRKYEFEEFEEGGEADLEEESYDKSTDTSWRRWMELE